MKGLEEYIAKHGRHFTEKLAMAVIKGRWKPSEIERSVENQVYYNVSETTLGDMVYLVNSYYKDHYPEHTHRTKCIKYALNIVGNVNTNGYAFNLWTLKVKEFDLTDFI